MAKARETVEVSQKSRLAIVDEEKCKPKNCGQPCKKRCPVNQIGKDCVDVTDESRVVRISEIHCIGCGICVKKCPYGAISIVNLPTNLAKETTHRFGANSFKLHRLPVPRCGNVLGLVGKNGTGKSTALDILSGKLKPNLGRFERPPDWNEIIANYRGSGLQNYFRKICEDNLKAVKKPQFVSQIFHAFDETVGNMLDSVNGLNNKEAVCDILELSTLLDRQVKDLSGGELQRFAIALVCVQKADMYMFDEPSSFLDIKQRIKASKVIRSLISFQSYVVAVEHDLALLDYLSDYVCLFYGVPTAYGVVTLPSSVREGLNIFLDGYIPTENMRFRDTALNFKTTFDKNDLRGDNSEKVYNFASMKKTIGDFQLEVECGSFQDSQITVLLGENGTGKTTLIKLLSGHLICDEIEGEASSSINVSYKPQTICLKWTGNVRDLLIKKIGEAFVHPEFFSNVMKPLNVADLLDLNVQFLSGGELQRLALVLCLGKPHANFYLIDEPSAYLDSEQRLVTAKVIKRYILQNKKTAFVVEHDFLMATYLADQVIVFDGQPSKATRANAPENLLSGMNKFLKQLDLTVRRDKNNFRPRINKYKSVQDMEQKKSGNYFFVED